MQKKKKKLCPGFTELFIDGILQILIKELFAQELLCKSRIFAVLICSDYNYTDFTELCHEKINSLRLYILFHNL